MTIQNRKTNAKVIDLAIIAVILMIMVVLCAGIYLKLAEKEPAGSCIVVGAKEIAKKAVDVPVIVTEVPDKGSDTYTIGGRTYKMFCQFSRNYKGYNKFLAAHGCMATAMTTILRAYVPECDSWTPYETIAITEKEVAGALLHSKNYSKKFYYQRPMSSYGATKILEKYGISYKYETSLKSEEALKDDLITHLRTGKPVVFTIGRYNRETKKTSNKWTSSYHTMIMFGVDKNNNILIGNPAGSQRFQMVTLDEMTDYMWSCTEEPNSFYWNHSKRCGGYIKIME